MDRLFTMSALVRVVETGSFSAAARNLRVGQPAVSKAIGQLEERLGVACSSAHPADCDRPRPVRGSMSTRGPPSKMPNRLNWLLPPQGRDYPVGCVCQRR